MGDKKQNVLKEAFWDNQWNFKEELDETTGEKRMVVEGILQQADIINLNNRIYPKKVLEVAVRQLQKGLDDGKVFGELDHPSWMDGASLKNTSHIFRKVWWDTNDDSLLRGEMVITNTPSGEIFKEVVHAGGRPGISSRGHGDSMMKKLKNGGEVEIIKSGFRFSSFDFVIDPSVKSAQITKVIENILDAVNENGEEAWYEKYYADKTLNTEEEDVKIKKETDKKKEVDEVVEDEVVEDKVVEDEVVDDAEGDGNEGDGNEDALTKLTDENTQLKADIKVAKEELEKLNGAVTSIATGITGIVSELKKLGVIDAEEEGEEEDESANSLLKKKQETLEKELTTVKEALTSAEVSNHISKVLEGKAFANILRERLEKCKTVKEVDAMVQEDEKFLKAAASMKEFKSKGKVEVEEPNSDIKKKAKKLAGLPS